MVSVTVGVEVASEAVVVVAVVSSAVSITVAAVPQFVAVERLETAMTAGELKPPFPLPLSLMDTAKAGEDEATSEASTVVKAGCAAAI